MPHTSIPCVPIAEQFATVLSEDIADYVRDIEGLANPEVLTALTAVRQRMQDEGFILQARGAAPLSEMVAVDGGNNVLALGGGTQYFAVLGRYSTRPGYEPQFSMLRLRFENAEATPMLYGVRNALEMQAVALANEQESFCIVDNSWVAVLENFNRTLTLYNDSNSDHDRELLERFLNPVLARDGHYIRALNNERVIAMSKASLSDKYWQDYGFPAGVPQMSDKAFLLGVLEPGEYTKPRPLKDSTSGFLRVHTSDLFRSREAVNLIYNGTLEGNHDCLCAVYFRPHAGTPIKRIEFNRRLLAGNGEGFEQMLATVADSMTIPGIQEPLEQFLVDRIIKSYSGRLPDLYQTVGYANLRNLDLSFAMQLVRRMRT